MLQKLTKPWKKLIILNLGEAPVFATNFRDRKVISLKERSNVNTVE